MTYRQKHVFGNSKTHDFYTPMREEEVYVLSQEKWNLCNHTVSGLSWKLLKAPESVKTYQWLAQQACPIGFGMFVKSPGRRYGSYDQDGCSLVKPDPNRWAYQ